MAPPTHRYDHPEGKGLGRHHADAAGAAPFDPAAARKRGLSEHEIGVLGESAAAMAALDLAHGTEVTLEGRDDERGLSLIGWTDSQGTRRITSVDPAFLASHFTALSKDEVTA